MEECPRLAEPETGDPGCTRDCKEPYGGEHVSPADRDEYRYHQREAEEELLSDLGATEPPPSSYGPSPEEEAEAKLRELKRLMGKD